MPRAPVAGREIRRRSRNGCWNCKARKVKCGEEKPRCANCTRLDEDCDYKIRLSWGGRPLKKKLLEQGAQIDDPSQNIPGAGQFSINQFNPAPSHSHTRSFPTTPTTPSTSRPSAGVKKSSKPSSKPGMPVYQNVFSVCGSTPQNMLPVSTMPNSQYCVAPAFPQQSLYPGLWTSEGEPQQPLTPLSTLGSEHQFPLKEESYAQYAHGHGSFMPQMASPTPSLATLAMTSPTSATNSSMPSPQQSFTDHVILNQQSAVGSPSGHMKASASPEVQYRIMPNETTSAMSGGMVVPSSGPLCNPMDYMHGPLTPPTEGHPYASKENARRLSVQNLLAAPVPSSHGYSQYGPNIVPSSHFPGENMSAIDPSLEDAEVEEIPRYDAAGNLVPKKSQSQQPFLGVSGPLGSVNAHSVYLSIPRSLHPLPAMLMDNVESAMYFHHFLTHTASLLVPHDCGRNPFKTILPQSTCQA